MFFTIEGIEPRGKHSMPERDKDLVQGQLLQSLIDQHRMAFRGPLALRLWISTTDKTPTHSHNIAKNLLDLFGKPRANLATRRDSLLYTDDQQVHALSVTCHHGQAEPRIFARVDPLNALIEDLRLVEEASLDDEDQYHWSGVAHRG